jgi:N-acetyl-anhydromuramyl-L-alanine amidase AmpD
MEEMLKLVGNFGFPIVRSGAHCNVGHRNFIGIGICLVGNFSETEVAEAQLIGLVNKVVQLIEAFKLSIEAVELHRDVPGAATECPGRYFPEDVFKKELEESFS